ncbi:MAG: conjugal transfer protein [Prevotella sp.]|nr:conjugal transfer protein [Prevotella sp.]
MKLAYLISVHTDVLQLNRLIKALPDNSVSFIHVDGKVDIAPFKEAFIGDEGVVFIEHRVNVKWGSINEVEYQMELVRAALECGEQFERLITISGMDYPVWSKEQIVQFFEQDREKEYLAAIDVSFPWRMSFIYQQYFFWIHKPGSGWEYYVTRALGRTLRLLGVKKPLRRKIGDKTYKLYKGAAWWAITPKLAKVILHEWDTNEELKDWLKWCMCPAELFAQTVAFNDESWKEKCIEHRGKKWGLPLLTPLTYIEWRGRGLIVELDEAYYDRIIQSGKMFCRKIVSGKSDALVEIIKEI